MVIPFAVEVPKAHHTASQQEQGQSRFVYGRVSAGKEAVWKGSARAHSPMGGCFQLRTCLHLYDDATSRWRNVKCWPSAHDVRTAAANARRLVTRYLIAAVYPDGKERQTLRDVT